MSRPLLATIDTDALEHNLRLVRRTAPRSKVMAVIKAHAYGHGLLRAAEALHGADGFTVMELDAAIQLREAGYRQSILLLEGFFSADELPLLEQYHLSAVIHHGEQLKMLPAYKRRGGLDVFIKLNTGMNRLGFSPEQFPAALEKLRPAQGSDWFWWFGEEFSAREADMYDALFRAQLYPLPPLRIQQRLRPLDLLNRQRARRVRHKRPLKLR